MNLLVKLWAFIKRDFQSEVSYRLAFVLQIGGMFFSLLAFFYMTGMIDPAAEGLDGIRPFDWMLIGLSFQFYFSTALYSFSQKIRGEQWAVGAFVGALVGLKVGAAVGTAVGGAVGGGAAVGVDGAAVGEHVPGTQLHSDTPAT